MKRLPLRGALCAILIGGLWPLQSALAVSAFRTASIPVYYQSGGSLYKFKDAGIQLLVPAGWEVETGKDGTVTFSKHQGDSIMVAAISTLPPEASDLTPEAQFKAVSQGVFENAKKDFKDLKLLVEPQKTTQNGMTLTSQVFSAKQDDVEMVGVLALLHADKPVLIFLYGTAKLSSTFDKEVDKMMGSIKKIE
jgi:hypothetical protein